MRKVVLLFLLTFFSSSIYSQSYLDEFTGIPLITYGSGSNKTWVNWYDFDSIKTMGSEVFLAPDLWPVKFDILRDSELKVIPWQIDTTMANYIAKYTDAVYTIWEAESSKVLTETGFQLIKSSNLYQYPDGLKTTSNTDSGYIISGPKYYQRLDYSVEPEPIKYFIDFNIKIKSTVGVLPLIYLESNTDPVCRIELAVEGAAKIDSIIRVKDFDNFDAWKEFKIEYSKNDVPKSGNPLPISSLYISPAKSNVEVLKDVEFKIHYYLETNDYLELHVDKITVSDERGEKLYNNIDTQNDIVAQATNSSEIPDSNKFTTSPSDFDSTVIGWYGVDEPSFIDNFACVKKVQELLNSIAGGKKLITSIAGSSDGKVHWGADTYRIDELMKRAELEEIILSFFTGLNSMYW
jgi:hypothetical protein